MTRPAIPLDVIRKVMAETSCAKETVLCRALGHTCRTPLVQAALDAAFARHGYAPLFAQEEGAQ